MYGILEERQKWALDAQQTSKTRQRRDAEDVGRESCPNQPVTVRLDVEESMLNVRRGYPRNSSPSTTNHRAYHSTLARSTSRSRGSNLCSWDKVSRRLSRSMCRGISKTHCADTPYPMEYSAQIERSWGIPRTAIQIPHHSPTIPSVL